MLNTIKDAKKYFEVTTAFNVDRFRCQSLISTAHKLLTVKSAINARMSMDEISKGVASISLYWYYKLIKTPMFSSQKDIFIEVFEWAQSHDMKFDTSEGSYNTDFYCQYVLVHNPISAGPELMNLETGYRVVAQNLRPAKSATKNAVALIQGKQLPVFNFTRRECNARTESWLSQLVSH